MPIVPAKCTQCGSNLDIDSALDAAICPFCHTAFITEKAINNYNTTNITNIGHADTINVYSNINDFEIVAGELKKYNGTDSHVIIPEGVRYIGENVFNKLNGLESIIISEGVVEVGPGAFSECQNLSNVVFPNTLKIIRSSAFYGCKNLCNIIFPSSLEIIEGSAFSDCVKLKNIELPNSLIELSGFSGTPITAIRIPSSVEIIGPCAFLGCTNLTSINFSNTLKSIGYSAFSGCTNLTGEIIFPNTLKSIEEEAFRETNITGIRFTSDVAPEIVAPDDEIYDGAFYRCDNLKSVKSDVFSLEKIIWAFREHYSIYNYYEKKQKRMWEQKQNKICPHCNKGLSFFKGTCGRCGLKPTDDDYIYKPMSIQV